MTARQSWLVLDVDDTLVATFRVGLRKCQVVAESLGLRPPTAARFAAVYGQIPFPDCVPLLHPGIDLERYVETYDGLADAHPPEPLCRLDRLLESARRSGVTIGVLTNGPGAKTGRKLAAAGLAGARIGFVRHADHGAPPKPDPTAFRRLADDFGVDPARAWYVSDAAVDWAGCRRAGFGAIGVVDGRPDGYPDGGVADLLTTDVAALAPLLPSLGGLGRATVPAPAEVICFDAGFTLIEHVRPAARMLADQLAARGVPASPAAVDRALSAGVTGLPDPIRLWSSDSEADRALLSLYRRVVRTVAGPGLDEVARAALDAYTAPGNWRARPAALPVLRQVRKAGYGVAVLANWQSSLPAVLRAAGLADEVDAVLPSARIGVGKPHPDAFRAAARALGTAVERLVHVGDDAGADVVGALSAGCRAVLVPRDAAPDALPRMIQVVVQ